MANFFAKITKHFLEISREDEITIFSQKYQVPKFVDPVFTKTSPKRSFSVIQYERFGLVFAKTGSIILGMDIIYQLLHSCHLFFLERHTLSSFVYFR
jgi:hypothetical protein